MSTSLTTTSLKRMLILHYYGEADRCEQPWSSTWRRARCAAASSRACTACSRWSTCRTVPEPGAGFERDVWARLAPAAGDAPDAVVVRAALPALTARAGCSPAASRPWCSPRSSPAASQSGGAAAPAATPSRPRPPPATCRNACSSSRSSITSTARRWCWSSSSTRTRAATLEHRSGTDAGPRAGRREPLVSRQAPRRPATKRWATCSTSSSACCWKLPTRPHDATADDLEALRAADRCRVDCCSKFGSCTRRCASANVRQ